MRWLIECTDEFEAWWSTLSEARQERVAVGVAILERKKARLGSPFVDRTPGRRDSRIQELRPPGRGIRILFIVDSHRGVIHLLSGGH
jgi:hypothetical protein